MVIKRQQDITRRFKLVDSKYLRVVAKHEVSGERHRVRCLESKILYNGPGPADGRCLRLRILNTLLGISRPSPVYYQVFKFDTFENVLACDIALANKGLLYIPESRLFKVNFGKDYYFLTKEGKILIGVAELYNESFRRGYDYEIIQKYAKKMSNNEFHKELKKRKYWGFHEDAFPIRIIRRKVCWISEPACPDNFTAGMPYAGKHS